MTGWDRRRWLGAACAVPLWSGCEGERPVPVRWAGASPQRGHVLRQSLAWADTGPATRAGVLVVGAGVAGLAAARALVEAGVDDVSVLDLEDEPGGNSRGTALQGLAAPLGAHYLPVPGDAAPEVQALLEALGAARWAHGRWVHDERMLCHSPQERLFIDGAWHDGLLPPAVPGSSTERQYHRFAAAVDDARRALGFAMPTHRAPWNAGHAALDGATFASWLDAHGLDDPRLRWYLDYCCRDDFGAGAATVSAWAGLHYFASRHGFQPGPATADAEPVLTWPEGNAWLTRRMAAGLGARVRTGLLVRRVRIGRDAAEVLAWDLHADRPRRWRAAAVVLAVPLFVAARLLDEPPPALAALRTVYAPWLVAHFRVAGPLRQRLGVPPSWDNVVYGSDSLGYVDAGHQRLDAQRGGPWVLSLYWALPAARRNALLQRPAEAWVRDVLAELAPVHPGLAGQVTEAVLARHGHAMAVPVPGARGDPARAALRRGAARLAFAHADLSAYSVFEEAYTLGVAAARSLLPLLSR